MAAISGAQLRDETRRNGSRRAAGLTGSYICTACQPAHMASGSWRWAAPEPHAPYLGRCDSHTAVTCCLLTSCRICWLGLGRSKTVRHSVSIPTVMLCHVLMLSTSSST